MPALAMPPNDSGQTGHWSPVADSNSARPQLVAARERDPVAFESIYEKYHRYIFGLASRILGSRFDAEEVCQDVFLELWSNPPEARRGTPSLVAWLGVTTRTRCWLLLRRHRHRAQFEPLEGEIAYWDLTFEKVFVSILREQLEASFTKIRPEYRLVLYLT